MERYQSDTVQEIPAMGFPEYLGITAVTVIGFIVIVALWLAA